ncbi:MAG: hypothetical protein ACXIUD_08760 [Mongoliitalea sp.]
MRIVTISLLVLLLIGFNGCSEDEDPLRQGNGEVVINVATRGSYQFIIRFRGKLYYPTNLPEEYKVVVQEPIPVHVVFSLTGNQATLFRPAANDVPIPDRDIPEIELLSIIRRN